MGINMERKEALSCLIPNHHHLGPLMLRNALLSLIPEGTKRFVALCIGSNRISGDSLGPFVGTLLDQVYPEHLTVMGSLCSPLDAQSIANILPGTTFPKDAFVIAIDSVLGKRENLHSIVVRQGPLVLGRGLGNKLPSIGDCSVMGVVVEQGKMAEYELVYADLHLVYSMAVKVAWAIALTVRQYFHYPADSALFPIRWG
jgi:putative sporulation protein YyaC